MDKLFTDWHFGQKQQKTSYKEIVENM